MFVATHAVEVNGPTYNKSFSESHSSTVAIPPPLEVTTSPTIKSVPFCALKVIVYAVSYTHLTLPTKRIV